jgi:hypothetical protein
MIHPTHFLRLTLLLGMVGLVWDEARKVIEAYFPLFNKKDVKGLLSTPIHK